MPKPNWPARDPSKPFNRKGRRVLFYLLNDGRLRAKHHKKKTNHLQEDPERWDWILEPMPHLVGQTRLAFERRHPRPGVIEKLQDRGILRRPLREKDEITRADIVDEAEAWRLVRGTDSDGNWLTPSSLAAIVREARKEKR